jgi:hypothetical protein
MTTRIHTSICLGEDLPKKLSNSIEPKQKYLVEVNQSPLGIFIQIIPIKSETFLESLSILLEI